jgi:hypothetical protein
LEVSRILEFAGDTSPITTTEDKDKTHPIVQNTATH